MFFFVVVVVVFFHPKQFPKSRFVLQDGFWREQPILQNVPYFFCYKTVRVFFFPNNHKNLDPSYKMDLDLWDCLGKVNLIL